MTAALAALVVLVAGHRLRPRPRRPPSAGERRRTAPTDRLIRWARGVVGGVRRRRAERSEPAPAAVADWCSAIARGIRSGDTLRAALAEVSPADELVRARTDHLRLALARGRRVADAVASEPQRHPHPSGSDHLGLALAVIGVCGRLGGSAAQPIDRVAATLRERAADDQERAAQSAQARLSAHVLTLLPLAVLGVLVLADGAVRRAAVSPAGAICVVAGALLNLAGWWWIGRIVGRADR